MTRDEVIQLAASIQSDENRLSTETSQNHLALKALQLSCPHEWSEGLKGLFYVHYTCILCGKHMEI